MQKEHLGLYMKIKINHNSVSFVKSLVRILAGATLIYAGNKYASSYFSLAGALIVFAEVLGIAEEIV